MPQPNGLAIREPKRRRGTFADSPRGRGGAHQTNFPQDDWLLDNARELIRLLPASTPGIGFTGGEPTIYGERLIELLRLCRNLLPDAGVHLLSNGRRIADFGFASAWAGVDNRRMMVGIPLYGRLIPQSSTRRHSSIERCRTVDAHLALG